MRISGAISVAALCAFTVSAGAQTSVAEASTPADELATGPNAGRVSLPRPPAPASIEIDDGHAAGEGRRDRLHLSAAIDFASAYFYRGYRQEDRGLIAQPSATVGFDVVGGEPWSLEAYAGTWHSLHSEETGAASPGDSDAPWYEADVFAGMTATAGAWEFGVQYAWFFAPNDAFATAEEVQFSVAYDDSGALGAWALSPSVTVALETGDGAADGLEKGVYAQAGVEPGFDAEHSAFDGVRVSFPVIAGFSLHDYYQDEDGEDNAFGFVSAGARVEVLLPAGDRPGSWSASLSVTGLLLGDAVNDGDDGAAVVAGGLSVSF